MLYLWFRKAAATNHSCDTDQFKQSLNKSICLITTSTCRTSSAPTACSEASDFSGKASNPGSCGEIPPAGKKADSSSRNSNQLQLCYHQACLETTGETNITMFPLLLHTAGRQPGALTSCRREARMAYKLSELGKCYFWSFIPLAKCNCTIFNPSSEMQHLTVKQKLAGDSDLLPTTASVGHGVVQGSGWNHPPRLALHNAPHSSILFFQPKHLSNHVFPR